MKKVTKNVFFGGVFGVALLAAAVASLSASSDTYIPFLSQTETGKTTPAELGQYQQLDCASIGYDIAQAQLALSSETLASTQNIQLVFGTVSGKGAWDKLKRREIARSETVSYSPSSLSFVTFSFPTPVDVDKLCPSSDGMAYMRLEGVEDTGVFIHGSLADAYAGPLYNCVLDNGMPCTGTIIDMAFVFSTLANNAPVIDEVLPIEAVEGEPLAFTLTATDPDGDSVTWGSGNLPEGAELNAETGEFSWTPGSDQVKDYKVTFVATDDGGPVEESSSITVFIHVVEVETPVETNELLEDTVVSLELDTNVENSYLANIKNVEDFIEKEQYQAAENQLNAIVNKLDGDLKKELITQDEYDTVLAKVNELLAKITVE